jgi:predicted porin
MKKTLVAMAVMAVAGAASAQATLYGSVDTSFAMSSQTTGGADTATGNVGLQMSSGAMNGSRWGMRATEDLGGGLSATVVLESGFGHDTGAAAQGGLLFGRLAAIGLAGGFGSINFGRQYTALDTVWGAYDAQEYGATSAMNYAWGKGAVGDAGRVDNMIQYSMPAMSGLTATVQFAAGEDKTPTKDAGSYFGLMAGYSAGKFAAHLGYESIATKTAAVAAVAATAGTDPIVVGSKAVAAVDKTVASTIIAASYDLGAAKLFGGYQMATAEAGKKDTGYQLGVSIPAGAAKVHLGYASETAAADGKADAKASAFGGHVRYPLSKRTSVYAGFVRGTSDSSVAAGTASVETVNTTYNAGLRHAF